MKVKIGDKFYDPREQPIMLILTDSDKENIRKMLPEATKYAEYPDTMDKDDVKKWMNVK